MGKGPRRNHSPALKRKVAVAAIKRDEALIELAQGFGVHPNQTSFLKARRGGSANTREPSLNRRSL